MTVDSFIEKLSHASGKNLQPTIDPWIKNVTVSQLTSSTGNNLMITRTSDKFIFPLEFRYMLKNDRRKLTTYEVSEWGNLIPAKHQRG